MVLRLFGALSAAMLGFALLAQARAIPALPEYAVLDEAGSLSNGMKAALRRLLTEHERVSGEQIVLAVFTSSEGEETEAFTRRVFDEWKVGIRGNDNGVLLALFKKERKAALMAGSAQGDSLGEAERKRIVEEKVRPEIRAGDISRAAALGALEILRSIRSPLVSDGRAERELRAGGFKGAFVAREWAGEPTLGIPGGWLLFLACIAVLVAAVLFVSAAEAHFTSGGWFRPSPWRLARWKFELWNPKAARQELGGAHGEW
jgi:uncharacterized membrane protein YgcG